MNGTLKEPDINVGFYESPVGVIWYVRVAEEDEPRARFSSESQAISYAKRLRHDMRLGQAQ